jgi:hypothetical protein
VYTKYILSICQIQFGFKHNGDVQSVRMPLLRCDRGQQEPNRGAPTHEKTWHRAYSCTGIKYCENIKPNMLSSCDAYDEVEPSIFRELQQQTPFLQMDLTPEDILKQNTYMFYQAHAQLMRREQGQCIDPETHLRTCTGQMPTIMDRHGVRL